MTSTVALNRVKKKAVALLSGRALLFLATVLWKKKKKREVSNVWLKIEVTRSSDRR